MQDYVNQSEFARIRNVSRQAVSKWVKKGMPGVYRDGRSIRIDPKEAAHWLDEGRFKKMN